MITFKNTHFRRPLAILGALFLIVFAYSFNAFAANKPFADIHLHYKWDQEEVISPEAVLDIINSENIALGVISGVPTAHALKISQLDPKRIINLFSPYITPIHKRHWFIDQKVVDEAEKALSSGKYVGIGELHLWAGFPPSRNNKILTALFEIAKKYNAPFLLHTETSRTDYIIPICKKHKDVRFLWAHAGGKMSAKNVALVMESCPNLWSEVSARDTWRYDSLTLKDGTLPDVWKQLFARFPNRFMVGTDPVWSVTKGQRWDEADEGWSHYSQLLNYHRHWLKQLPADVEEKIRLTNALSFFKLK